MTLEKTILLKMKDESDEDFAQDEPTAEIEDNIDTIANSSNDDESEKVRVD